MSYTALQDRTIYEDSIFAKVFLINHYFILHQLFCWFYLLTQFILDYFICQRAAYICVLSTYDAETVLEPVFFSFCNIHSFAQKMLCESGLMDERDYSTYRSLFLNMSNFMKKPNIIVHLDVSDNLLNSNHITLSAHTFTPLSYTQVSPEESLRRIHMRLSSLS